MHDLSGSANSFGKFLGDDHGIARGCRVFVGPEGFAEELDAEARNILGERGA